MEIGDTVVRKSYGKDITFRIIDIKDTRKGKQFVIKGLNLRLIADSPPEDLEPVKENYHNRNDEVLNKKVNNAIKKILSTRQDGFRNTKTKLSKHSQTKELIFGRAGKVLHIDGDSEYLESCLNAYNQLSIEAIGKVIPEADQPEKIVEVVKENKPDIVVLTGHDSILKDAKDYRDLSNYRNSQFFVDSVKALREFEASYDDLVIFAGACQSCYERILDAGANFASSPSRVLIHCLDPVFVCEKVAYTNIENIVPIQEVLDNTITGIKGIGGLQTRGKYREGYPKSPFL